METYYSHGKLYTYYSHGELDTIRQADAVEEVLTHRGMALTDIPYKTSMTEDEFRDTFGWSDGILDEEPASGLFGEWKEKDQQYQRVYTGAFSSDRLSEIKADVSLLPPPGRPGRVFMLLHDPSLDAETDVRGMMANPQFNGAAFQFASTMFGPLEGGKFRWDGQLSTLHHRAVQGEFATISTLGAAIWRKYILPGEIEKQKPAIAAAPNRIFRRTVEMYSLQHFGRRLKFPTGGKGFHILKRDVLGFNHLTGDVDLVKIPVHQDVCVTYGYGKDGRDDDSRIDVIPLDAHQRVTCIFSSTVNLNPRVYRTTKDRDDSRKLQKVLLEAAYSGAVYGAVRAGCKKLVLTLVGGGSFRNDADIIFEKMLDSLDVAISLGLDVYINYRYDSRRDGRAEGQYLPKMIMKALKSQKVSYRPDDIKDKAMRYIASGGKSSVISRKIHKLQGIDLRPRVLVRNIGETQELKFLSYFLNYSPPMKPTYATASRVIPIIHNTYGRFTFDDGTVLDDDPKKLLDSRWKDRLDQLKKHIDQWWLPGGEKIPPFPSPSSPSKEEEQTRQDPEPEWLVL
jgi:hypothetical protein